LKFIYLAFSNNISVISLLSIVLLVEGISANWEFTSTITIQFKNDIDLHNLISMTNQNLVTEWCQKNEWNIKSLTDFYIHTNIKSHKLLIA
jgi:hypothetical protein